MIIIFLSSAAAARRGRTTRRTASSASASSASSVVFLALFVSSYVMMMMMMPVNAFSCSCPRSGTVPLPTTMPRFDPKPLRPRPSVGRFFGGARPSRRRSSELPSLSSSTVPNRIVEIDKDDEEDDDCPFPVGDGDGDLTLQLQSPALVRGTPLQDQDKVRNKQVVHAIKTVLFDTLFRPDLTSSSSFTTTTAQDDDDVLKLSYRRFYALETIARTPYFAYVSALHLLETIGQWRQAEYLKLHFCEAWNELHHLLILEQLLHRRVPWRDQFVAQHVAVAYYWFAVLVYLVNPTWAYNLNQAVEEEAYETYDAFLTKHSNRLQSIPAPDVAIQYYTGPDLYLFDSMHHHHSTNSHGDEGSMPDETQGNPPRRRPKCVTLYDTFVNIRDDEMEHVKTMAYLQGECANPNDRPISQPNSQGVPSSPPPPPPPSAAAATP